ncbi:kinase-like protein [Thozetella sp. PMI_491]|nr:kinase-like protein [Thozetella sp. PMI_491]
MVFRDNKWKRFIRRVKREKERRYLSIDDITGDELDYFDHDIDPPPPFSKVLRCNDFYNYIEEYIVENDCYGLNGFGKRCGFASSQALRQYWTPVKIVDVIYEASGNTKQVRVFSDSSDIYNKYLIATVVLKEYYGDELGTSAIFLNEVAVYSNLREESFDEIVKYYGSFRQVGVNTLILEQADGGTLANFFERTKPIERPEDRLYFWREFLGLLRGLDYIHNFQPLDGDSAGSSDAVIHQNIRPQNILVFKGESQNPYDVRFKWTDFRSAQVPRYSTKKLELEGNVMYSAPEWVTRDVVIPIRDLALGPSDIWSFGAVASETLIWSIFGERKRGEYQDLRSEEHSRSSFRNDRYEGCFHDGHLLLKIVEQMHATALNSTLQGDNLSPIISSLILDKMLVVDPKKRPDAIEIYNLWLTLCPSGSAIVETDSPSTSSDPPPKARTTNMEYSIVEGYHIAKRDLLKWLEWRFRSWDNSSQIKVKARDGDWIVVAPEALTVSDLRTIKKQLARGVDWQAPEEEMDK